MAVKLIVPDCVKYSLYHKGRSRDWAIGLYAHNLQCGRRWLFLLRIKKRRFGYLTAGDSSPDNWAREAVGWHWPWKKRSICGGRG